MSIPYGPLPLVANTLLQQTTVQAPVATYAVLINESPFTLRVDPGTGNQYIVSAFTQDLIPLGEQYSGQLKVLPTADIMVSGSPPSSILYLVTYGDSEQIPGTYPAALARQVNVGNTVTTGGSVNSINNQGESPPVDVIFDKPSGYSSASIHLIDTGELHLTPKGNATQADALAVIPGGGAGSYAVVQVDNGLIASDGQGDWTVKHLSATQIADSGTLAVTGSSSLDNGNITTDGSGNVTAKGITDSGTLTVTGSSSLDNGKVTTNGSGVLTAIRLIAARTLGGSNQVFAQFSATDVPEVYNIDIFSADHSLVFFDQTNAASILKLLSTLVTVIPAIALDNGNITTDGSGNVSAVKNITSTGTYTGPTAASNSGAFTDGVDFTNSNKIGTWGSVPADLMISGQTNIRLNVAAAGHLIISSSMGGNNFVVDANGHGHISVKHSISASGTITHGLGYTPGEIKTECAIAGSNTTGHDTVGSTTYHVTLGAAQSNDSYAG